MKKIDDKSMAQAVLITIQTGEVFRFTGRACLKPGDKMVDFKATEPYPLPKDCYWELEEGDQDDS